MPNYRRRYQLGGCWFFTVNLKDRSRTLLVDHIDQYHRAVLLAQRRRPFEIDAWVVLPDHLHAIWTLPKEDTDFPSRWRDIKVEFSKSVPKERDAAVWQRGYWEHLIADERDFNHHVDYCWFNPVKHGMVTRIQEWPHSSFHRNNADQPRPGDLEKALKEYAERSRTNGYGERP